MRDAKGPFLNRQMIGTNSATGQSTSAVSEWILANFKQVRQVRRTRTAAREASLDTERAAFQFLTGSLLRIIGLPRYAATAIRVHFSGEN
jgi:hypothetical protein